jgi:hypothetical protein
MYFLHNQLNQQLCVYFVTYLCDLVLENLIILYFFEESYYVYFCNSLPSILYVLLYFVPTRLRLDRADSKTFGIKSSKSNLSYSELFAATLSDFSTYILFEFL